jgi:ABC-type iron transport system FetAB permease component
MTIPNENQDACFSPTQRVVMVFLSGLIKGRATGGWADVGTLSYQIALMLMKLLSKVMACHFVTP